jgi:hypothetical protein
MLLQSSALASRPPYTHELQDAQYGQGLAGPGQALCDLALCLNCRMYTLMRSGLVSLPAPCCVRQDPRCSACMRAGTVACASQRIMLLL